MKKTISFILSFVILFTMMPTYTLAAEASMTDNNQLIALACEVFPEYASIILGEQIGLQMQSRSVNSDEVVFSETRQISDNQSMNISLLASGEVIVIQEDISSFDLTLKNSNTSDITTVGVSGSASFTVTSNSGSGTFTLSNVQFVIYYNSSDYFSSTGSASVDNGAAIGSYSTSSTHIHYPITFNMTGATKLPVDFQVYFSNNKLVARIY